MSSPPGLVSTLSGNAMLHRSPGLSAGAVPDCSVSSWASAGSQVSAWVMSCLASGIWGFRWSWAGAYNVHPPSLVVCPDWASLLLFIVMLQLELVQHGWEGITSSAQGTGLTPSCSVWSKSTPLQPVINVSLYIDIGLLLIWISQTLHLNAWEIYSVFT